MTLTMTCPVCGEVIVEDDTRPPHECPKESK